jgi:hypothetical protein
VNIDECLMDVQCDKLNYYNRLMDQNIDHLIHNVDTKFNKKKKDISLLRTFIDFSLDEYANYC